MDEATGLQAQRTALEERARRLTDALAQRARLLRSLQTLSEPVAQSRDAEALTAAEQALKAAQSHAEQTHKVAVDLRLAQLTVTQFAAEIRRIEDLKRRLASAGESLTRLTEQLAKAEALTVQAAQAEREATGQFEQSVAATRTAAQRLEHARRAQLVRAAQDRAVTLAAQLERAERQRKLLEDLSAARAILKVTPVLLDTAEKAQGMLDRLTAQDDARQVAVTFVYDGDARVLSEGRPLGAEECGCGR